MTIKERLQENIEDLIALHNQGLYNREIGEIYGVSEMSVSRALRNVGITRSVPHEDTDIINDYKNGETMDSIAKKYRISTKTISNVLKSNNIHILTSSETSRKYNLNEYYFDNIDNQDKAYCVGLLYADGCHSESNYIINLSLQERDKDVLIKINELIGSNRPLRFLNYSSKNSNWSDQYQLSINSKHMSKQLASLGMIANKSLKIVFPDWLEDDLIPHFLRGYIDGDGHLSNNPKDARMSIVGTLDFCESVKAIVKEKLNINCSIYFCHGETDKPTRTLQIAGRNQMSKFLDYIYKDANLYLKRKYNVYKSLYCKNINNTLTV